MLFHCCFARQVWALSSIPNPKDGFADESVFANINFFLNLESVRRLSEEQRRVWPWIMWNLWKRRNEVVFEGRCLNALEMVQKASKEADEWSAAQAKWTPPEPDWVMCNVGMEFAKSKNLVGGAWVLRNERGVVLCHSRRAFSGVKSRDEAKLVVVLWAFESMRSQRQSKIVFAEEFSDLFGAALRPQAWPSFRLQSSSMELELAGIQEWKLSVVTREANRGAFFIAQSVTKYGLINSYVASGHPSWLSELFGNESWTL
ncbi:hypothetical protein Bca52824_017606 [Brassica carinata]|uniref:RNase H type-1 domain-containing protein n=1 Tax=Brassica carinata TaxID=52824 RepID=A0A8X8AVJ8_BRACI|nr:hypothetical protein Bca52824_017606 [Brassica carinata]